MNKIVADYAMEMTGCKSPDISRHDSLTAKVNYLIYNFDSEIVNPTACSLFVVYYCWGIRVIRDGIAAALGVDKPLCCNHENREFVLWLVCIHRIVFEYQFIIWCALCFHKRHMLSHRFILNVSMLTPCMHD